MISVIIPVFCVEKWLHKCVDSILCQTYKNLEIILVDDGSPDNCPQICDTYAKADPRIVVIHQKNSGVSAARNAALDIAKGQYIMFLDSDDWVAADICEVLRQALTTENADIAACGYYEVSGESIVGQECTQGTYHVYDNEDALRIYYEGQHIYPAPWCKLYKKALWDHIRFPDVYREDEFIFYRLLVEAKKTVHTPQAKYYYNIRQGSAEHTRFARRNLISNESIDLQYEFIKSRYPQLESVVWDMRIRRRIMQLRDIALSDCVKAFRKEYDEMLEFLRENQAYNKELALQSEQILQKGERFFLREQQRMYMERQPVTRCLYKTVRRLKRFFV